MASVSSIGVGSGLPLDQLLTNLRNSENNALVAIQSKQVAAQNRLSAYGKLQSAIEAFQNAGKTLSADGTFGALKTNVSGEGFSASASTSAIAGQYSISVQTLATAQTLATSGQASRNTAIGADGVLTFTLGDGTTKTLDLTGKDTSLDGLVSAINKADPSLGFQATIVNDGSGTPYHLLLTSTTTGSDAAISSISVAGNDDLQTLLGFDHATPAANPNISETAAVNATFKVNGISITSQKNSVSDAIQGVTLSLTKEGSSATLTVTRDDTTATKAVNDFINAYNSLQNTVKSLTSYNVDTSTGSALTGDSLARRVQTQFREVVNVSMPSGTIRSLSQIGIKSNATTGELTVDSDKLSAALKDNLGDVKSLLAGTDGVTSKLKAVADSFLGTKGLINAAKDGTNDTIKDLAKQYEATSYRIDAKMAAYSAQFTALDSMVAQMNSVSSYLTQQLTMLSNLNNSKK